jgi:hypothetical protein
VRPNTASLNSLAEVLRRARPLYAECHSILNYLDAGEGMVPRPRIKKVHSPRSPSGMAFRARHINPFEATLPISNGLAGVGRCGIAGRDRMRRGAYQAHIVQVKSTEKAILGAIRRLRLNDRRVTMTALASAVGMSHEHLSRRYRYLFKS